MKLLRFLLIIVVSLTTIVAGDIIASEPGPGPTPSTDKIIAAFRQMSDVAPQIATPTVVQVPLSGIFLERPDVVIVDESTQSRQLFLERSTQITRPVLLDAAASKTTNALPLVDRSFDTSVHFDVSEVGPDQVHITLTNARPLTTSGLSTLLSSHVALPTHIEIRALINGEEKIVVANQPMQQSTVNFPITTSDRWLIMFTYTQPLRIDELRFIQEDVAVSSEYYLRFLAQPGHVYRIYADADHSVPTVLGETADLASDIDVVKVTSSPWQPNPRYVIADSDQDTVPDVKDNCIDEANLDQADLNTNGRGDVCDDFDKDGIVNSRDNCRDLPNRNQTDTDGDKIGDACDGEESRLTEANPWLPWAGLGIAAVVVIALFALTARSMKQNAGDQNPPETPSDSGATKTPPGPAPE